MNDTDSYICPDCGAENDTVHDSFWDTTSCAQCGYTFDC